MRVVCDYEALRAKRSLRGWAHYVDRTMTIFLVDVHVRTMSELIILLSQYPISMLERV